MSYNNVTPKPLFADSEGFLESELPVGSSKDFRININTQFVEGYVEELGALLQSLYLMLQIPRYRHEIFNRDIGNEIYTLIGEPLTVIERDLPYLLTQCVLQDERVESIKDIKIISYDKDSVEVTFTISTIFGTITIPKITFNMEV